MRLKKIKNNTLKWLINVPKKKNLYIVTLMIIQAVTSFSGVFYALLLSRIVDSATEHNSEAFWHYVFLIILLVAVQLGLRAVIRWLAELSYSTFENIFKERLLNNILNKDFASVNSVHSGEWLNRLTNDTVIVANGYVDILPGLTGMIVKMVSALIMITAIDYRFACVIVPGGVVLVFLTYAFRKILKKLHKHVQETDGKLRIFLQEHIGSMMIIRSFAAEHQTESEAVELMSNHKSARMRKNMFSNFCNVGFGAAMNGMYIFGVCYCGYGILQGTITYGTLTAMTQLISQIQSPFANITGYLPKYYAMSASAERLMEIEDFENDSEETALSLSKIQDFYSHHMKSFGLKNAKFTYYPAGDTVKNLTKENMPVVLKNISLKIEKGKYIAFTGHSGCGKSTVLKLLMCIYKLDGGERFISDVNGKIRTLSPEWHRLFAYVPQGNQLMSGTIREVVAFADKSESENDEKIMRALKIACAYEFISELENGIDTLLGERGTGLSEGQMQRVAIARAVFSESPVLLLDEATSALDELTEKRLLENLRKMTDKTVVIVTHRPAALEICDIIYEFTEKGIVKK